MILQGQQTALELFQTIAERLNSKLKTQVNTFFLPLILGALLAPARRRTVTTWLLLLFGMTELATWNRSQSELVNRVESPWDDEKRRPSHADRRNEYTTNT